MTRHASRAPVRGFHQSACDRPSRLRLQPVLTKMTDERTSPSLDGDRLTNGVRRDDSSLPRVFTDDDTPLDTGLPGAHPIRRPLSRPMIRRSSSCWWKVVIERGGRGDRHHGDGSVRRGANPTRTPRLQIRQDKYVDLKVKTGSVKPTRSSRLSQGISINGMWVLDKGKASWVPDIIISIMFELGEWTIAVNGLGSMGGEPFWTEAMLEEVAEGIKEM